MASQQRWNNLKNIPDEYSFLRPYLDEEEEEDLEEIPEEYSFLRPYVEEKPKPVDDIEEIPKEYSFLKPYLEEERPTAKQPLVSPEAPTLESLGITPIEPEPQESILRSFADPFLNVAAGVNDVVKGFADAFGADNPVSQNLAKNSEWYRDLLSAGAKQDQEEIGRIMQEAEGQGVLAEIGAGLKALSVAPVDLVSQGIGSLIPFIATAGVGKAVGLSRAGVAVLQGVQGGAVGGGIVKGEIYDAVKEQLINSGVDEAQAEKAANEAQAYNGKNLDQILLGVGLGVAASTTGAEGAIRGLIARKVGKEAAEEVSERAIQEVLRTGFVRGAVKDGIVETATEALQGGQEKLAANIAVGREGFDVDPMAGVFTQTTLEGAIGGILGGTAGGISAKTEQLGMRQRVALRDAANAAQEAKQNNAPASAAAVEEQIEQTLEETPAETPEQKVARLQEEAAAAAGIELEEEVGVEPTVPVTPPTEPTPEGAVAPVEPVVEPVVAEPQPAAEVPAEPVVTPKEPLPEDKSVTIFNYEERAKPIQDRIDAKIDELVESGMTFEEANNSPEVAAILEERLAMDRGAINSYRNIVNQAFTEQGVTENDLSINPAFSIIENVYAAPRQGDEGLIAQVSERGQEAFDDDAATIKKLSESIFKYRAEAEGLSPEGLLGPESNLTDAGKQARVDEARIAAETIHNQIKNSLLEQSQAQPETLALPPTEVAPEVTPEAPNLEPLRRVARAEQAPEDIPSLVEAGLVEVYKDQPVITDAGLAAFPEAERPRLTPEARKIQIDTGANEVVAEAISKNLRIGVDQVGPNVTLPAGWTLDGDIYVPPAAPEVRESRREPSVEARQQYAPKTEEEQKAFDKASSNKVLARSPQLAVAAVRMKNGEITSGEYADLVDAIDPFTAKGADPIPTKEKIQQYISSDKAGQVMQPIESGKEVEFRIDIPTYNRSTAAGDTVYAVTAHEPVAADAKGVGKVISFVGVAKVNNPTFMTRAISGRGTAADIAAGAGKFPLATVKGNYEPITDLPADINDPNVWTEVGYNPIRSSFFVDTRSKDAVVGGSEAIMVGSRVFVKDAVLEPRPTGVTMGERYARMEMPRPAGMETEAVTTKLESLGFGRGGIVSVVNEPNASFEGRTIIRDGKVVGIELNAAALKDDAAVERVLNHEIAESANADGALNNLVAGLTPKERKEINDAITRLGYAERARTAEEAARAVELLAEGWRGRKWFERAVARIEAWANKLGYKLTRRAAEYIAARNVSEINTEFKEAYNKFITPSSQEGAVIRESRREDAIPTFSEGSPEASTLSTMAASMAKVDAASEGKPNPENKPTYKISEIASVWMDQGGDARQLQDLITENTLLSPANAQKVANAIAKQYDIQQSISTAFAETALGLSAEALPEGATLPKEVDPDRPKPVMQRLFDVFMGVRVPPVKLTVNEKTALKDQIRLKAAAFRDAKKAQKEVASGVVEAIKEMDIRGPIRPKQAAALMKRAAMINFANEKSVDTFITYAEKVIENANYDKDLADAKLAQKRAKEIAKRKDVSSNQSEKLIQIGDIDVKMLDNPREFAEAANHYMRAFKSVVSPDYVVIPDEEMTSYLADKETEALSNLAESDYNSLERLANKYGVPISEVNNIINAQDVEKALLEYGKREIYEGLVTDKAKESLDALQRYDTTGMTMTQKKIVDRLLGVEADAINIADRVQLVRRIDNLLVNGRTNGLQKFVDVAEAQTMARKAARDKTFSNQMKAWVNIFVGAIGKDTILFGTESQRKIALSIQSVADTFRNIFGKENMAKIQQMMGYRELVEGTAKFNNESRIAAESMAEFYEKLGKKHGKKAEDRRGLMAEGVASYLIQKFPNKSEADSIVTRRSVIREDIAERRRSGDKDQIADAVMIEEILNSIDGDTNAEILANLKKDFVANYESLVWLKDTFLPQYKDTLKEFDENYNDQVNNYDNPDYLPVKYSFRQAAELKPEVAKGINDLNSLQPKQSANTIKRIDYSTLPRGESGIPATIGYNLRKNVFGSLSDQLKKAYTSSAWTKIDGFLNSRSAIDVLGSEANVKFMSDRLRLLKDSQDRKSYERDGAAVVLDAVSVLARKIGIGMALGGYGQALKQAPDQMATTIANTGRADLQNQAVADLWRKDSREKVMKLLTKYSIGNRGDAAMGGARFGNQMESSYSNLERFFVEGDWAKVKFYANKTADVWLEILKKSDFLAAASGWMTYYQVALEKAGVEFTGWENEANLIDADSARQEAAIYAESMIDLYQGSSDPTRMATLAQRGKSGYENAFKTIFLPFNSFVLQQRTRILSDAREALINATDEQSRREARRGLAGTLFGIMIFHSMRRYALPAVSGLGAAAVYAMLGVDPEEPDEEKQREEAAFKLKRFYSEIAGNVLVGGFGSFIEQGTLDAFNQAAYFAARQINDEWVMDDKGEIMDYSKWKRDRAPFWYYSDYKGGVELGMFNIGFDQLGMAAETAKKMTDPELMDTLTEEERRLIYLSGLSEFLFTMRLNDTDVNRMFRRMRKETEATAKEREAEIRKIRSGR